jgi:hypothetical protein
VDTVLPREKPHMHAAAQKLGLKAGLSIERNDTTFC